MSQSEAATFRECRRKWYLGTYRQLQPKEQSVIGPLPFGTRIHACLEAYYTDGRHPLDVHRELVENDRLELVLVERDATDLDKEAELGRIMLEGYLEWLEETGADADYEVVSSEEILTVPLLDGAVEMVGKLDMRMRRKSDGVRLFVDHKTAANPNDIAKMAAISEQFLHYHMLEALKPGETERCDGGVYNILRKVKRTANARPPFYERIEVRHNRQQLLSYWNRFHGIVMDILRVRAALDAGGDHLTHAYPTPNKDCSWKCPFYAVCPLMDDGSAAEAMLEDFFVQGDPMARYAERENKPTA
jgi:RecB family exonuclease